MKNGWYRPEAENVPDEPRISDCAQSKEALSNDEDMTERQRS